LAFTNTYLFETKPVTLQKSPKDKFENMAFSVQLGSKIPSQLLASKDILSA
jgi:hypothetical protein